MAFIDLIFPRFCLGCGLPGTYCCPRCQTKLVPVKRTQCFYCKKDSLYGLTHPLCLKKLNIDGVDSFFFYNDFLKKIIKNLKYRLATDIGKEFFQIIKPEIINKLSFYKKLSPPLYFQPIPLSQKKLRERGFNQAFLLTKFLQKFLDIPIVDLLVKAKETKNQAELKSKKDRYNNLRGAFEINQKDQIMIRKSRIILVDDVITTGSTIREAAKILKKYLPLKVYALTLARG